MLCPTSAELLAAVDFGDAMSNPLHKKIDFRSAALDSDFARHNLRDRVQKPDFFPDTFLLKPRFTSRNRVNNPPS
ncbi:hypothetical protein [Tychonema sp. LEGE 07203]|uniref:hypothetical protein n=1 Tax=Tychonema sp. LEGE 07203 TaxID=1828671 RepID=UPI001881FE69|nr:hypothetical protein [Tychonema sp. LEGE 07203]MBE9095908.1 hypothetical protein [Tychonema sp. LEGE 07203]